MAVQVVPVVFHEHGTIREWRRTGNPYCMVLLIKRLSWLMRFVTLSGRSVRTVTRIDALSTVTTTAQMFCVSPNCLL